MSVRKNRKETSAQAPSAGLTRLAVFDFDGTSIVGNSPVLLVAYMAKRNMLRKSVLLKILTWAFAYKMRLPQKEAWVRGLVFSAFDGMPKDEVDRFLRQFYDDCIEKRFRKQAEETMRIHRELGNRVLVVSATFEPIVLRCMENHPFDYQISTRMKVDSCGNYTREVEGEPIEGEEKFRSVQHYADSVYGRGSWQLSFAYGDHHSDIPLLAQAEKAFVVDPDNPLERRAKKQNWEILHWDNPLQKS